MSRKNKAPVRLFDLSRGEIDSKLRLSLYEFRLEKSAGEHEVNNIEDVDMVEEEEEQPRRKKRKVTKNIDVVIKNDRKIPFLNIKDRDDYIFLHKIEGKENWEKLFIHQASSTLFFNGNTSNSFATFSSTNGVFYESVLLTIGGERKFKSHDSIGIFNCSETVLNSLLHLFEIDMLALSLEIDAHISFSLFIKKDYISSEFNTEICLKDNLLISNKNSQAQIVQVFQWLCCGSILDSFSFSPFSIYKAIVPSKNLPEIESSHLLLKSTSSLRPYQRRCVYWMIKRETGSKDKLMFGEKNVDEKELVEDDDDEEPLNPLWSIFSSGESSVFLNQFNGAVRLSKPENPCAVIPGGILADEMGLGKTLEMISTILFNPCPDYDSVHTQNSQSNSIAGEVGHDSEEISCLCGVYENDFDGLFVQCEKCFTWQHGCCVGIEDDNCEKVKKYICPCCRSLGPLLNSKCTVIVTPTSILDQWQEEIIKHTNENALKVAKYLGIKFVAGNLLKNLKTKESRRKTALHNFPILENINPYVIKDLDVLLISYDVLKSDIYFDKNDYTSLSRSTRYGKRYLALLSPLTKVYFYRACLDEAQMVESTLSKSAIMANRISSKYRWAVTGTPINSKLDDIYGLLLFLRASPFDSEGIWKRVLMDPYLSGDFHAIDRLHQVLKHIMWRNNKVDVVDEIDLPTQTVINNVIPFTSIEESFYNKQLATARQAIFSASGDLELHLLRLRQACNHPTIGSAGIKVAKKQGSSILKPLTLDEIKSQLIIEKRLESEECQRIMLASLSGRAGLKIIEEKYDEAISLYKMALEIIKSNEDEFAVDLFQRLHLLKNLSEILEDGNPDKKKFLVEVKEMEDEYSKNVNLNVQSFLESSFLMEQEINSRFQPGKNCTNSITFAFDKIGLLEGNHNKLMELKDKVLAGIGYEVGKRHTVMKDVQVVEEINSFAGLRSKLVQKVQAIDAKRTKVLKKLKAMAGDPSALDIRLSADCKNCKPGRSGPICPHCLLEQDLINYQDELFTNHRENKNVHFDHFLGLRKDEEEDIARSTFKKSSYAILFLKFLNKGTPNSDTNMKAFDDMQNEIGVLYKLYNAIGYRLNSLDEIAMATYRITLALPGERIAEIDKNWRLPSIECIPAKEQELNAEFLSSKNDLATKTNQLTYLKSITDDYSRNTEETCAICLDLLKHKMEIIVLICGHRFCKGCLESLAANTRINIHLESSRKKSIRCPTCRGPCNVEKMMFVDNNEKKRVEVLEEEKKEVDQSEVKGSYGSKVTAILSLLLKLKSKWSHVYEEDGEDEEGVEKVLVFSLWEDVLAILASAFKENDISFLSLCGGNKRNFSSTLTKFKFTKNIQVLLLPINAGGNGLNIIEASHVILVEPSMNKGLEAQAIGRIHRIGQTKKTFVHRFIIKDSVEEKIYDSSTKKVDWVARGKGAAANKEQFDVEDIKSIINDNSTSLPSIPTPASSTLQQHNDERYNYFWSRLVQYNNQKINRSNALSRITNNNVFSKTIVLDNERSFRLFCGKRVNLISFTQLLTLKPCVVNDENVDEDFDDDQLVETLRKQLNSF